MSTPLRNDTSVRGDGRGGRVVSGGRCREADDKGRRGGLGGRVILWEAEKRGSGGELRLSSRKPLGGMTETGIEPRRGRQTKLERPERKQKRNPHTHPRAVERTDGEPGGILLGGRRIR